MSLMFKIVSIYFVYKAFSIILILCIKIAASTYVFIMYLCYLHEIMCMVTLC